LVSLAVAGYYFRVYSQSRELEQATATAWRSFDDATAHADDAGMRAALQRLIELRPDDPVALGRQESLRLGSADSHDVELAKALVSLHLDHDRLPEAAREARKVLAREPRHWRSLCVLSHHAMRFNHDMDEARRWLDALPDPGDPETRLDPGGLLHAMQLSRQLDRDTGALRRAIIRRVLPFLRSGAVEFLPPLGKAQLIDCYLQPFSERSDLPELLDHWGEVSRLAHSGVAAAEQCSDTIALVRLGTLGHRLRAALICFSDNRLIPQDRFALLARELDNRIRRTWLAVLQRDRSLVEPYIGLAELAVREGEYRQAVERLLAGLANCGERQELNERLANLASATGNWNVAVSMTRVAAEKDSADPDKWCRLAAVALAGGQYDTALAACGKARTHSPNYSWAIRIQLSAWMEKSEPGKALDLLWSLGECAVRSDPSLVQLVVRALVESGDSVTALALTDELERAELTSGMAPVRTVAALRGFLDARTDAVPTEEVARRTLRLSRTSLTDPPIWRVLADAHLRSAESISTPWDPIVARTALEAYGRLPSRERTRPEVIAAVATLQLKALNDPQAAWRTLGPFRDPSMLPLLRAGQLEILGAGSRAVGKLEQAITILERAVRDPSARSGCWVELALAYHAAGRLADARGAIDRVTTSSMRSAREQAEWLAARQLLDRVEISDHRPKEAKSRHPLLP
jgi:tetratricopeptide (TPR) repeat protein